MRGSEPLRSRDSVNRAAWRIAKNRIYSPVVWRVLPEEVFLAPVPASRYRLRLLSPIRFGEIIAWEARARDGYAGTGSCVRSRLPLVPSHFAPRSLKIPLFSPMFRRNMRPMNTNQILSNLRKQKKKIDSERERLHHAIVAFERLAGKAIEAGKKKYRMSRTARKKIAAGQKKRWAKFRTEKMSKA